MDPLFIIAIISGVALVFLIFAARLALRWVVRLVLACVLLLAVLGGAAGLWLNHSSGQSENKPRSSNRANNSNRR